MSDNILPLNPEAAKHRTLVNSFKEAADLLSKLDFEKIAQGNEVARYGHVSELAQTMADRIKCPSEHREAFADAALGILVQKIVPNLMASYEGHADYVQLSKVRDQQKMELVNGFIQLAIDKKMLPEMLRQHKYG